VRRSTLIPALLAASILGAGPGAAQVRAPTLVEEDLPPEEQKPAPAEPRAPEHEAPAAARPAEKPRAPEARAIEPVKASWATVLEAWHDRRRALREADEPAARAAAARLLDAKLELAIENLHAFAASEVREAERAVQARLAADAVDHAELAVRLAPDLADAHLALARARLARDPGQPGAALSPLGAALRAAWREPHSVRAFLGDVLAAGLAALAVACALAVLLLFLRQARLLFHDFGHLPLVRAGTPLQSLFLGAVLLALPVALGLGPWAGLAGGALAVFAHLSRRERLVVSASLLLLTLLPWGAEAAGRLTAWTGSLAEEVFEIEHGADGGERVARLSARPDLPAPALLAVGRFHKRRGRLDEAMRWYERAAEKGRTPELLVATGNVRMLRGDAEGAKAAWLEASDRAEGGTALAAAQYNLSKLYLRASALEQSQQARRRAQQVDGPFLARSGSDDDFRANRWILDAPLEHEQIRELAAATGPAHLAREAVRARLAGAIPPGLWPWAPLCAVALIWLLLPLGARLKPSSRCERCGRPACPRCDAQSGPLCGQCVNVFQKKGVVDPRDRARKEAQVRRRDQAERWTARGLALVGGGAGHLWLGEAALGFLVVAGLAFAAFVVVFWRGIIPPPHPSPYLLAGKLAVVLPLGVLLYALAVRDAFRRTRG